MCCLEKGLIKFGLFSKFGIYELCKYLYWNRNKIIVSIFVNLLWKERELWWVFVSILFVEKVVVVDLFVEVFFRIDDI